MSAATAVERRAELARVAEAVRPVTLAREQRLPVLEPLQPLLPEGGLRRGSVVGVEGPGSTSLLLALLAEPSRHGSWAAFVGLPQIGLAAAAEMGVALDQVAVVAEPSRSGGATTVAALLDAFDVVVVAPEIVGSRPARRLVARARERGSVLVLARHLDAWGEGPDVRLRVVHQTWHGLEEGHGHLRARQVTVAATGRRDAARPRQVSVWLTDPDGRVAPVLPAPTTLGEDRPVGRVPVLQAVG